MMSSFWPKDRTLMSWIKTPESLWDEDFTLQKLTIKCIIEHYKRFLIQAKETNPFEKLPNELRNEILKSLDKSMYGYPEISFLHLLPQLLINKSTSELELRLDTDEKNTLWSTVVSLRPNLKSLKLIVDFPKDEDYFSFRYYDHSRISIPDHLLRDIIVDFVELENLDIKSAGCLNDEHLGMIAAYLKNLKILHFDFDKITFAGLKKLATLKHLRNIYISEKMRSDSANKRMWHNVLSAVPQLQDINYHEAVIRDIFGHSDEIEDKCFKFSLLQETPIQLGLRQLILCKKEAEIPSDVTMTNLDSLILIRTRSFAPSSNFNKLTKLCLGFLGLKKCNEILGHLGRQLQELNIMEDKGTLYLDDIAEKCPMLEDLYLPEGPPELATNFGEMSFDHLKCFIYNESDDEQNGMVKFGPRALTRLLSGAPNLKEFSLTHVDMSQMELDELVIELKKGNLLQKLETFWYNTLRPIGKEARRNHILRIMERYATLAEEMKLHCPCLDDISGTCAEESDNEDS